MAPPALGDGRRRAIPFLMGEPASKILSRASLRHESLETSGMSFAQRPALVGTAASARESSTARELEGVGVDVDALPIPTPLKFAVCGLFNALSCTVRVPIRDPVPVGLKITLIVQL